MSNDTLRQQTETFWLLQLQFMARSSQSLADAYGGIRYGSLYSHNRFSSKMATLLGKDPRTWTDEEHHCLATHIALQLAGIEE